MVLAKTISKRCMSMMSAPQVVPTVNQVLIHGKYQDAASGETFDVVDPRTEQTAGTFAKAGAEDVDRAVASARKAFDEGPWPRMSGRERGKIMMKISEIMQQRAEEFAQLETLDNGKPILFSRIADIPLSWMHFEYFGGYADKIHGEVLTHDNAFGHYHAYTQKEPIGVAAQIIPWNFPLLMAAWKLAPALAAGCTVVLKPSEKTPMTSLLLGQVMLDAGLPEGVVNILPGFGDVGSMLAAHPGVDKVAFTGSVATAKKIQANLGIKPFTAELGGKSPAIVFGDCDVQNAVDLTSWGLFFNHGQCCCAGSRVFVHETIYDEFIEKMIAKAEARKVGDPFGEVDQGPLVDKMQFDRVMGYINRAKSDGVKIVTGGDRAHDTGYFVQPTVMVDVPDNSEMQKEEIFGPVMGVAKFSSEDEVIARANDTNFGLAAGVFSDNVHTLNRVTRRLKAGTVWQNCYNNFDSATPFGGYKESGIGREKGTGAVNNYLQTKTVIAPLSGELGWYR